MRNWLNWHYDLWDLVFAIIAALILFILSFGVVFGVFIWVLYKLLDVIL